MTNLQQGARRLPVASLRLIWLLLPVGVLGGLGLLVLLAALVPLWAGLQRDSLRLQELEQLRDQVTLMRGQLVTTQESTEAAMASKAKIERLITGNGDLSTFLAMLDREAGTTGVELTLFEPTQAAAGAPGAAGAAPNAPPQPAPPQPAPAPGAPGGAAPGAQAKAASDPLALQGLTLRTLLVSAKGSFPSLLSFLRRLEALNVLVVQSDLNLSLAEDGAADGATGSRSTGPVVMKLTLGLYSRTVAPAAAPAAATPAPPGSPHPPLLRRQPRPPHQPADHADASGTGNWPFRPIVDTIFPIRRATERGKTSVAARSFDVSRRGDPAGQRCAERRRRRRPVAGRGQLRPPAAADRPGQRQP